MASSGLHTDSVMKWDNEDADKNLQGQRMLDYLCRHLDIWSTSDRDVQLRESLKPVCSFADRLGHKLSRSGPRYEFDWPSSGESLSIRPTVHQMTSATGKTLAEKIVVLEGIVVKCRV